VLFADVPADNWAALYIYALANSAVTSGCGAGNYCPEATTTRAQMAVFIIKAMGQTPSAAAYDAYFTDIANDGFAPYINRLFELGVTWGCGANVFCPSDAVSRAQMAVFIVKAMGETPSAAAYDAYFTDIANDAFAPYINRLFELGITWGCGTNIYCPSDQVSRAQMAVFVGKAFLGLP
jgi:hypothetical protein